ncbi:MAG: spermidine/putrescine ABC transporter substrate-binding protein [Deltaproteobacteria bacterium]|jgi:spermidine/putrescine transport system substrate-binding protein|nr:spermidine/putrescine ABC transporter substrate-binding protein [Deltaproteobacteria bacterium]
MIRKSSLKFLYLMAVMALVTAFTACGGGDKAEAPAGAGPAAGAATETADGAATETAPGPGAETAAGAGTEPAQAEATQVDAAATKTAEGKPRQLYIFIWSEYIDMDVVAEFEKTFNVKVNIANYESNEEMVSALKLGRQGAYDLIVPTTYFLPSMINQKLIQPLNKELLPNMVNLDPEFTNLVEDPGNVYTVPYQWGTSGLVVRAKPGQTFDHSFEILFKPSLDKGNFIIFDTARDALGAALKYLGYSANTTDKAQLKEAGDLISQARDQPTFLSFSGGVDGLANVMGNVASIAQVYNGEAVKAAMEDPEIQYIIPKEGCEIWLDVFAIPTGAANYEVAHEFLNFIMIPENAAKLSSFSKYATPNAKALELIPEEELNNPGIYPPPELRANMEYYKDLGNDGLLYEEIWTLVKSK